jgi:hypothetical protein
MLGTLLDRLSGFFSKYFLIGSFFPALIVTFANGVLLWIHTAGFPVWVTWYLDLTPSMKTFYGFVVLVTITVAAYVLSVVRADLREVLEGKHWPERRIFDWFVREPLQVVQRDRLKNIEDRLLEIRKERRRLRKLVPIWKEKLGEARERGTGRTFAPPYDQTGPIAAMLEELRDLKLRGRCITAAVFEGIVDALAAALERGDADSQGDAAKAFDAAQVALLSLFEYAKDKYEELYVDQFSERQASFGHATVAPTRMGNIAQTIQSYGATRYAINLATLWPRFQRTLAANETSFTALQEAKSQLDFLVATWWLTAATVGAWAVAFVVGGTDVIWFLGFAVAGPCLLWIVYRLGCRSYLAFAQLIRSAVDLQRFDVLKALHIALPVDLKEERDLWDCLSSVVSFGETRELRYDHAEG